MSGDRHPGSSWTDTRRDEAKRMWSEGMSASEIAGALGEPYVSRNSVIGVLHRAKVPKRQTASHAMSPVERGERVPTIHKLSRKRLHKGALSTHRVLDKKEAWAKAPKPVQAPPAAPDAATNVTLLDAGYGQCRHIAGEPNGPFTLVCGGPVKDGLGAWCEFHSRLCYQPPASRHGAASLAPRLNEGATT